MPSGTKLQAAGRVLLDDRDPGSGLANGFQIEEYRGDGSCKKEAPVCCWSFYSPVPEQKPVHELQFTCAWSSN